VKRVHLIVSGSVHEVGFRYNTRRKARLANITGYARNLPDGSVEIEAQGTPEALDGLIHWAHHGPPDARVDSVIQSDINIIEGESEFEIR
jgi:acylphosphatase